MNDSMYTAMFGALTQEHRLDIIANNLANVNTTAYKQDKLAFKDVMVHYAHDQIMEPVVNLRSEKLLPDPKILAKPRIASVYTDFSQGGLELTGNPLDLAIQGEAFFKVRTPGGDLFTRDGHFVVNDAGTLVTPNGYPVLGQGAEITLPANGEVLIDQAGQVYVNGELVDQLELSTVDDLRALEKVGHNFYRLPDNAEAQELAPENATVEQGYLESANVQVVEEMVNMIEAQRAYEAYSKVIKSSEETDQKAITKVGQTS